MTTFQILCLVFGGIALILYGLFGYLIRRQEKKLDNEFNALDPQLNSSDQIDFEVLQKLLNGEDL